jgi:hypothetical protein
MNGFEVTRLSNRKWVIFHWNVRCGMKEYQFRIVALLRATTYIIEDWLF